MALRRFIVMVVPLLLAAATLLFAVPLVNSAPLSEGAGALPSADPPVPANPPETQVGGGSLPVVEPVDEQTDSDANPLTEAPQEIATEKEAAEEVANDLDAEQTEGEQPLAEEPEAPSARCRDVAPFRLEDFNTQKNPDLVYVNAAAMPVSSLLIPMGFTKFTRVFGLPIVATGEVSAADTAHYSRIFAEFLDNDADGKPDDQPLIDRLRKYTAVTGILGGPRESVYMWEKLYDSPKNVGFRDQFECNIHFFEQWRNESNPMWHHDRKSNLEARKEVGASPTDCKDVFSAAQYDMPLWYFLFTISYYGWLDNMSDADIERLNVATDVGLQSGTFKPQFPEDPDMILAEFLSWSILTNLGGLECHCHIDEVAAYWKLCTAEALQAVNPEWIVDLEKIENIVLPTKLPTGKYSSPSLIVSHGSQEPMEIKDFTDMEPITRS